MAKRKNNGQRTREKELTQALMGTLSMVANEQIVLLKLEPFFSPKPAKLDDSCDVKTLDRQIAELTEMLGGPPRLIVRKIGDDSKEPADYYPVAALNEVINMFHRVRRSVCRTHMVYIGATLLREEPELLAPTKEFTSSLLEVVNGSFWEYAETAYIRLASYWDRVGQLLDFAFFGIRQFERDGFSAVIDRIAGNYAPRYQQVRDSQAWKSLRSFQSSEAFDGSKWLLRRRNLVVHSVYLRPLTEPENSTLFEFEFNHLDEKLRKKLCPGTEADEIERLSGQLRQAANLFPGVLELCKLAASIRTQ